ncbi:DUF928 domain-containing protein [Leptolyngbya sp. CCNP1308]|uniref:DUF928 domain-containing protein n=1 Tax=Leptolyngbya sp. CCNP1308 TaxID=3110255 RepID=UPI002B2179B6|nr:DUF928 domain-containing protein [Leptolyngbya sp. CCNP1308]MEA5449378.1 DUF928 domain-containing protein [Leptolyngbya sp. CCNP1308]
MSQFSGMHKLVFVLTKLTTGSLISLVLMSNHPAWGSDFTHHPSEDNFLQLSQGTTNPAYESPGPSDSGDDPKIGAGTHYRPPEAPREPRRTTGGGTRGGICEDTAAIDITALAPRTHIGQTTSTRPTLTWFVADETPYPVQIQLYRYRSSDPADDGVERLGIYNIGPSQPGYMTFTLPDDQSALMVGETYRWKVILQCSPSQPSRNRIDEADLVVVAPPADPVATVSATPVELAEQYGAAGLWYDAIAVLSQAPGSAAADYRRGLIADLAELEAANPNDEFSLLSDRLTYIAEQD